jgi:hypothetical protein
VTSVLLAISALVATVWCYRRWWLAVRWILVLLVLEGAVRKWLLPEHQQVVYLAKDVFFAATVAGYLTSRSRFHRARVPLVLVGPLVACALWGAFEALNPKLPTVLVGAFGWKAYFWYVPLLWLVPASFRDLADLVRFFRRYSLLLLPMLALGWLQFRAPTTSALNRYAWGDDEGLGRVATFGAEASARVTGTFTYISGFTTYLVAIGVILLIVLGLRGFRWRGNLIEWVSLLALPVGIFVSGSRGPLVLLGGIFPLFFLLARRGTGARANAVIRLLAGTAIAATLATYVALPALEAFSFRVRTTEENVLERALEPLSGPFTILSDIGALGYGIGATHQAASTLVPGVLPGSWLDGLAAEAESTRVMIELGPIGFLLHYFYRIALVVLVFLIGLRAQSPGPRVLALGAGFFLLAHVPGAIIFNVYAGIYFWFLAGCALLADAEERRSVDRGRAGNEAAVPATASAQVRLRAR